MKVRFNIMVSIENLNRGIDWWLEKKNNWTSDFLNLEYYAIYQDRNDGLTEDWLGHVVDRLARWKALRSPKPPNTKEAFLNSLRALLPDLKNQYERIRDLADIEPSINTVSWNDIKTLYVMMAGIKNMSPMFASKLGHFIFPNVFIVMDNVATEVIPYDYYWQGITNEWYDLDAKSDAVKILETEIKKHGDCAIHPSYPFETKIMELCHVGDKANRKKG